MKTEWDYTNLAEAYLRRPDYAPVAIQEMLARSGVKPGDDACDVGAGAAHLTLELAKAGLNVCAVEPNDAMRANGIKRTKDYPNVSWFEGVGEDTGMEEAKFQLVTFGSSFSVCDRQQALVETNRILKSGGWFACMWNHRDLEDSLQKEIEEIIKRNIPGYQYGTRREDQTAVIEQSGLYKQVEFVSGQVVHHLAAEDFVEGWKSHATVYRQAPALFERIVGEIRDVVASLHQDTVAVPYITRIWMAQVKK